MKYILMALTAIIPFVLQSAAWADIRVEFARDRSCRSYSVLYTEGRDYESYIINLQAGQWFEIHNVDPYVSLVYLISPQGDQVGDFLMGPEEVKGVEVPISGEYRIELANDKDYYDLRFCAY